MFFRSGKLITVIFHCILWQPVMLFPYAVIVINGPLAWFGRWGGILGITVIIQLYGQCMVNVTACFVYRYQKVGQNKKKSYYGVMLGVTFLCKCFSSGKGQMATLP